MGSRILGVGLDSCGSGQGLVTGSFEYGNESLGSIKHGEFLNEMKNC
jgi:hypothetical protein